MDKKVLSNSAWMSLEKVISIFGMIFVTSFVAKYIGPDNFGKLSFVSAIFMAVQTISMLGSEHVLAKRISRNSVSGIRLMISSSYLRSAVFLILTGPVLFWLYVYSDRLTLFFGTATAVAYYFVAADVYSVYNDARLNSSINALYNVTGLSISFLARWAVAYFEMSIYWLALPIILAAFIPFILKRARFRLGNVTSIKDRYLSVYSKYLFFSGFPLAISSTSIIIYAKVSQLFLMRFEGGAEVGVYSVATTLGTAWTFITSAFVTSAYTRIYATKDRSKAIHMAATLNRNVFGIAALFVVGIFAFGKYAILLLYGKDYIGAYPIMLIMCLNSIFSCMGPVANKYIIYESGYSYISKKMVLMLFFIVPISYVMTKYYGIYGAAWATVLSEFIGLTLLNYFFNKGVIAKIHALTISNKKI